ncbi:MAG: 3'(2'),5'-bisphosphate nucleotidase CysQ [Saprospiraceae bacterium]|nr:3'(2'),5'-bisphosphate nucleotidase CysQ [Saprospiraceae bacterium]
MNLNQLVNQVYDIAIEASVEILKIYNSPDFNIQTKTDESPVTAADLASNRVITEGLSKLNPQLPILSEETLEIPYAERSQFDYFWMVDPLDGTKEFIKRNGEFTINIALIHRNKPVLGVVYVPITEGGYFATQSGGAFKKYKNSEEQIRCSTFRVTDKGLKIPTSRSHRNHETDELYKVYDEPVLVPCGSALKFLKLADGSLDIYPRIGTTMEWDTAAPQIILEEAGGQILEWQSRQPLSYNKEDLRNPNFLAHGIILPS